MRITRFVLVLAVLALVTSVGAWAQQLAPDPIAGKVAYVPFPVDIKLDGKLDDWKNVPWITVNTAYPPAPADDGGSFKFAVAAKGDQLYITFVIPKKTIIAGKHGNEWYNEDSFEIFTQYDPKKLMSPAYGKATSQISISPLGIGNTDPNVVSVQGVKVPVIVGYTFKTTDGWGFEGALTIPKTYLPLTHGAVFGFNAQENASVGGKERDHQVVWSIFDPDNNSWQQPKVFGRGVFYEVGKTDVPPTDLN